MSPREDALRRLLCASVMAVMQWATPCRGEGTATVIDERRYNPVKVSNVRKESLDLWTVVLDLSGTELPGSYSVPGQYVQLQIASEPRGSFFAIASPPGPAGQWELLVRTGSELPDRLVTLPPGAALEVTPAQGTGFPLDRYRSRHAIILSMGSGLSATRSLVEHLTSVPGMTEKITVIHGVRTPADLPYTDRFERWKERGVRMVITMSRAGAAEGWTGPVGHVQDHLTAGMLSEGEPAITAIGSREMLSQLREKLTSLGRGDLDILTNY